MKKDFLPVVAGVFFLVADQITKFFLTHSLNPGDTIPVIKNIFHVTLVLNTGCAFGLFRNQPMPVFLAISLFVIVSLLYFLKRLSAKGNVKALVFSRIAAILLISGSLSNLIDRLRFGYVIDFLDFRIWPVFNLGDTAITIGVMIFVITILFNKIKN